MSFYGNTIFQENGSYDYESDLNMLKEYIDSYKSYKYVVSEMIDITTNEFDNYVQLMNESGNEYNYIEEAGKFSVKSIWEAIKKFIIKVWNFIKEIPNKVKALFAKLKSRKVIDDFDEFFDDFEEEFPDEDLKVDPGKTEEQYEAEINKLKSEIDSLKSELGDTIKDNESLKSKLNDSEKNNENNKNKSEKQNKLNMKRNELQVLKIKKAIKHILDNDILYWSPFILLNNYQIDLSNYKNMSLGYINDLNDLEKIVKFESNEDEDKKVKDFLMTLVRPEVLSLDPNFKFDLGGFDHYKLNDYAKDQMNKIKKKNPITDPKTIIDKKIYFDQTGELERLLINLRDVIGLLNSKIQKVTPIDPNDTNIYFRGGEYYKVDEEFNKSKIDLSQKQIEIIKLVKEYIYGLECASQVVSVAAKFQGQYMGAIKSSAIALKSLV